MEIMIPDMVPLSVFTSSIPDVSKSGYRVRGVGDVSVLEGTQAVCNESA